MRTLTSGEALAGDAPRRPTPWWPEAGRMVVVVVVVVVVVGGGGGVARPKSPPRSIALVGARQPQQLGTLPLWSADAASHPTQGE